MLYTAQKTINKQKKYRSLLIHLNRLLLTFIQQEKQNPNHFSNNVIPQYMQKSFDIFTPSRTRINEYYRRKRYCPYYVTSESKTTNQ